MPKRNHYEAGTQTLIHKLCFSFCADITSSRIMKLLAILFSMFVWLLLGAQAEDIFGSHPLQDFDSSLANEDPRPAI